MDELDAHPKYKGGDTVAEDKGTIAYKVVTKDRESVLQLFINEWCDPDIENMLKIAKENNLIKKYIRGEEVAGEAILCFETRDQANDWIYLFNDLLRNAKIIKVRGFDKTPARVYPFLLCVWAAVFQYGSYEGWSTGPRGTIAFKKVKVIS